MRFLSLKLDSILEKSRRKLVNSHLQLLQLIYGKHPIPLWYWLIFKPIMSAVFSFPNPLFPSDKYLKSMGSSLQVRELRQLLCNDVLGDWALDGTTIELLWGVMQLTSPKVIIECGAGISTLVLAKYASLSSSNFVNPCTVFSLEQDIQVKQEIDAKLMKNKLERYIHVLHVPVSDMGEYKLCINKLWKELGIEKADLLLIDGPLGPEGCRLSTLPLLARFCRPGARWFLDDALRNGELWILRKWSCLPGVRVEGIYPLGKGLGTGVVEDPHQFTLP